MSLPAADPNAPVLYVSDLDGTLLDAEGRLSERSRRGLKRLLDKGLPFTVATARSVYSVRDVLAGLELPLPVIEFNGAMLSELDGNHHQVHSLPADLGSAFVDHLLQEGEAPLIATAGREKDTLYYNRVDNDGIRWLIENRFQDGDQRLHQVDDYGQATREQMVCITTIGREERIRELKAELGAIVGKKAILRSWGSLYAPGWHWMTLHAAEARKELGLQALVENAGLQGWSVTCFGDGGNDAGMLAAAHRGIAMANAGEATAAAANLRIGPNTADSVVRFLEIDWDGKRLP